MIQNHPISRHQDVHRLNKSNSAITHFRIERAERAYTVYSLNVITVESNIPFHSAEWSSIKALGTLKAASGVSLIT